MQKKTKEIYQTIIPPQKEKEISKIIARTVIYQDEIETK